MMMQRMAKMDIVFRRQAVLFLNFTNLQYVLPNQTQVILQCVQNYSRRQQVKTFDLSVGASLSMADNLSMQEGTYTHAYLKVSKDTKLKSTLDFSPNTRFDLDGREGKFCFTDGRSIQSTYSIITCSNTAAPEYSSETIRLSDNNTYNGTLLNYEAVVGSTTIYTDLYMVDSDGAASTSFSDDFAIMGTQELSTAVTINPATTGLDVGFSVTNGMSFGFMQNGDSEGGKTCNQAAGCLNDAVFDGIKFLVKAE